MLRPGEAAAAEDAGLEAEVAAVFLGEHVTGDFGSAEERVEAVVDGEGFRDAVRIGGVVEIPAGFEFFEGEMIGAVAVDFIGAQMAEDGVG